MYRDESETHLDDGHSHNFATAFLRNLRCSAVTSINVWACHRARAAPGGETQTGAATNHNRESTCNRQCNISTVY